MYVSVMLVLVLVVSVQPTLWRKVDEVDSSGKTAAALVVHQGNGGVGTGVGCGNVDIGGVSFGIGIGGVGATNSIEKG